MTDRLVLNTTDLAIGDPDANQTYSFKTDNDGIRVVSDDETPVNFTISGIFNVENEFRSNFIDVVRANVGNGGMFVNGAMTASQAATLSGHTVIGTDKLFKAANSVLTIGNTLTVGNDVKDVTVAGNISATNDIVAQRALIDGTDLKQRIENFMRSTTRLYVKTTGNDANDGTSWDRALKTIAAAATIAQSGTTIYVETGTYTEINPIRLKPKIAVIGDNLRNCILKAVNPTLDYFHVDNLDYLYGLRFIGLKRPAFCVAFPCAIAEVTVQNQQVVSVSVLYSPTGYTTAPPIIIEAPESPTGTQATAIATVSNGVITGITVTNPGSGYIITTSRSHVSIPSPSKVVITGSPYIQNCSSITGPFNKQGEQIPETTSLPYNIVQLDVDQYGAGGGCRIDGACCANISPLRSFVADSFTQVNQGGPGHLIINLGYAQFVSCFTTFASYSFKSVAGGHTNISTSVTDFGNYGLVATGYWPISIASGTIAQQYRSSVASVIIPEGKGGSGYTSPPTVVFTATGNTSNVVSATAVAVLFGDRVDSVTITNAGSYSSAPTVSFQGGGGSGAEGTVLMSSVSPIRVNNMTGRKPDIGSVTKLNSVWYTVTGATLVGVATYELTFFPSIPSAESGDTLTFHRASMVSTGQHVTEYVGSGVTYNALPEYGGVANQGNETLEVAPARVYYGISDHIGNQRIGPYFAVEQLTGTVTLQTDRFNLSGLGSIGPFKRNGNPVGVRLTEVSNNPNLISSTGAPDAETVPTQTAVKAYVDTRTVPAAGTINYGLVKNSSNDYDVSWRSVVLTSEKNAANGVPSLDVFTRIVGDGSIVSNISATNITQGTLNSARLQATVSVSSNVAVAVGSASAPSYTFTGRSSAGMWSPAANVVGLSTTGIERLRIDAQGNIGINTILPTESLHVTGSANVSSTLKAATVEVRGSTPTVYLRNIDNNSAMFKCDTNLLYVLRGGVDSTSSTLVNGQNPLYINLTNNDCVAGGNVSAVGNMTAYASDKRLKQNIRPLEDALDKVCSLRGVRFAWKEDTPQPMRGEDIGLIAQDVQHVLPEAVSPAPFDLLVDGSSKSGQKYLTIDSGNKLVALLVEAVKELAARVDRLEK